ncbi:hypothetical protein [uncultured Nitrosomonas sp.]|uniref:hypothetical protein n=1 Tax=uncultured Nitrosomonas sp. TaxID=156424 RepID=UPI00262E2998|nr:hypothetical protein [uncultured Nitrosomonas sp.]
MSRDSVAHRRKELIKQLAGVVEPIAKLQPEQAFAPHDEALLERARTQWQFGDWDSLAQLNRDALQHHPARAELALLAAAGRLQTGENHSEARRFIRLAQNWGASKKLISRILIAGVYSSLGRAAAIGNQPQRALQHFENAVAVGIPGGDTRLLTQARSGEQFSQLGLHTADVSKPLPSVKNIEFIENALSQQKLELDAQFKKQADDLIRVRKFLDTTLKKEVANAAKQVGDFITLQSYFNTGKFTGISLETNGWPVSSDFMLYLVKLVEQGNYDVIIEFGSGSSTLAVAKTLALIESRHQVKPTTFVSFDHLEQFYQETHRKLAYAGMSERVHLVLAPLINTKAENGNSYLYYDCRSTLANLAKKCWAENLRVLAIVDGPPGSSGKHARYMAGPYIFQYFKGKDIDLLLDDTNRKEEEEIIGMWKSDVSALGLSAIEETIKLEKGACLLRIQSESLM